MFRYLLLFLLCAPLHLGAQETGVQFLTSWDEAITTSQRINKPIFLDAYTTWCAPCIAMDKFVFSKDEVATFLNTHFVPVKLDMEKPENLTIANAYSIIIYPTLLFVDSEGAIIHRKCGASMSEEYDWFLDVCRKALDDNNNLRSIINQFNDGPQDIDAHLEYLSQIVSYCHTDSIAAEYALQHTTLDHLYNPNTIRALWGISVPLNSDLFHLLVTHKDELTQFHENTSVESLIKTKFEDGLYGFIDRKDWLSYDRFRAMADTVFSDFVPNRIWYIDLNAFEKRALWKEYTEVADTIYSRGTADPYQLNSYAYTLYESVDDPALLARALEWIASVIPDHGDYYTLDTYAALLFKTGDSEKALGIANEAIASAKETGIDYTTTQELLDKYKK